MSQTASGPERDREPHPQSIPGSTPAPLTTAASLVVVEGLLVTLFGIAELASLADGRLTMGLTTALFFSSYGVGLIAAGWGLTRRHDWARGPVLFAQLIQLGVAWNLWGSGSGGSSLAALGLGLVALIVLAGMLHPASIAALKGVTPG